jgi:hypothetical protein
MSRKHALSCLAALACFSASSSAFAEEWHYCVATAGLAEGPDKHVHWAVTQPFEVSSIPDWRSQFEQAKLERNAFAQSRGWESNADSFICTDGAPSFAAAQDMRNGTSANFAERRDIGEGMGLPFTWEDWAWQPTGSGAPSAQAEAESASSSQDASDAQDDDADATADAERQKAEAAQAAAAEAKRQKDIAEAQAERDRLAAEKARLQKEIADAKAERDRLAVEKAKQEREAKASTDTDANRCVTSPNLKLNDTFQGNTAAYVTNGCGTPVDVRICLMTEAKGWNCGMTNSLQPQASWSWSSMHATGQTFMDARVQGSNRPMASP